MRSTTDSNAELINSTINTNRRTPINASFSRCDTGSKIAITTAGTTSINSCRNAYSVFHAVLIPAAE